MSGQHKKSGNKLSRLEKVLLVTAVLNLIRSVIDLINDLIG